MKSLPLPLRVAAGLVVSAVDQARDLPRLVVEFPVTAVSQALQASMRVQQKVTELAIKGDRALGTLRPVEEKPSWATFDEDEPARRNGSSSVTELRPPTARIPVAQPPVRERDASTPPLPEPETLPGAATTPKTRAARPPSPKASTPKTPAEKAVEKAAAPSATATPPGFTGTASTGTGAGPNVMPGYQALSIPQLRGKLRHLSLDDLRALLTWENAHDDRPAFVTMLTNRITTVTEG